MKRALWLVGFGLLGGVLARADDKPASPPPEPIKVPATATAPAAAPATPVEPAPPPVMSGIDFDTTPPEEIAQAVLVRLDQQKKQANEIAVYQEAEQRAEADRGWMLRAYNEQLTKRGLTPVPEFDSYGMLKPAARKPLNPANDRKEKDKNADLPKEIFPASFAARMQPLLSPLTPASRQAAPMRNAFGNPTEAPDQPPILSIPAVEAASNEADHGSMLDVPGLTAAQGKTPLNDTDLERLPDEPIEQAKKHQDSNNFLLPTPVGSDVQEFYKKQAASLAPPHAPTYRPPVVPPLVVNPYKEPKPLTKPATGMRSHVDDPFDYLHR